MKISKQIQTDLDMIPHSKIDGGDHGCVAIVHSAQQNIRKAHGSLSIKMKMEKEMQIIKLESVSECAYYFGITENCKNKILFDEIISVSSRMSKRDPELEKMEINGKSIDYDGLQDVYKNYC